MPVAFRLLIAAQFFSGLADNALLIVAIARLQEMGSPLWWVPMLRFAFTLAYVVFAPVAGPWSDALAQGRLMAWMNVLKLGGAALLLGTWNPLLAFAIVGLGAAVHSPAKYGLVNELVPPSRLVAANGWIEMASVASALLGTAAGGVLLQGWAVDSPVARNVQQMLAAAGLSVTSLALPVLMLLALYALAAALNFAMRHHATRPHRLPPLRSLRSLVAGFCVDGRLLWADHHGRLALAVSTLFWGAGATLQFMLLRWAEISLGLQLEQGAYLQALVAVGVLAGAGLAGRVVPLARAPLVLPCGVAMGLLIPLAMSLHTLLPALPLLLMIGLLGGVFLVPMNALLQHRGGRLLSTARSIAVQNFAENMGVLVMLGVYTLLLALNVPTDALVWLFGVSISFVAALLWWYERHGPVITLDTVAAPDT